MPIDDDGGILPPSMGDRPLPQTNRTVLGLLLALLFVAVLLALWFLIFDDGTTNEAADSGAPAPTALVIPTSTPVPDDTVAPTAVPTSPPTATATAVPEGFESCGDRGPLTSTTYIVDTNTTPLNQREDPAVGAPQAGTFDPGQSGLVFTGDCVVNLADGYVWWQINNGTADVWVASNFVTPQ